MVIEWIDPGIFRWIVIGIWFAAASRGLIVCGGNYHKARDRRKEFFRDGPESLRRGVIYRHRFQRKLFIAMCAAAAVGILAAILPRPIPLPPITLYSLLGNGLLLWFISLISGLSVDVRRYEAEVIEAQAAVDEGTLQGIAAQFTTNGGQSLRDVVDRLEKMLRRMEAGDVVVANNLVKDREMVHGVAVDLQASRADSAAARDRADAVPSDSDPGVAADAASQSGESSDP
jgi:xanthosine utilization system XapX-like protein